ncbi:uncharacterized protein LOC116843272 [Odontomachus brunneus]|uniref:uncharacterized protein LOC116843272 n=1 Tax=Odontomachus brunneus TaxID=486640 RepID=UPI0013F18711|nr:uncharacterized protein LOC116843272 [Odontomachus brunneus]
MTSAEDLFGLIEIQADRQHRISRLVENARKSGQLKTLPGVLARLKVLQSYWEQFVEDHRPLRASRYKVIRESEYIRRDLFGDTEELYIAQEIELRTIQDALSAPGQGGTRETVHAVPAQATVSEVQLPRVPIPTFDGAFDEWRTFRDLFLSLIGDNKSLADVHKMHYLKQHVRGEPERLLRHHPVTSTGYQDAWAALCERTCEIRSSLSQLGRPTEQWDDIFVYRTVAALDSAIRRDWERSTNKIRQPVRWSTLADFLRSKIPSGRKGRCALCTKPHPLWDCSAFKALAPAERRRRVSEWGHCQNCFSDQHRSSQCASTRRCRDCALAHHSLLHEAEPASPALRKENAVLSLHAVVRPPAGRALLATAQVQLRSEGGRMITVRALIDPGSEVNLISESAAQQLRVRRQATRIRLTGATGSQGQVVRAVTSCSIRSTSKTPYQQPIEALILPRLTGYRPTVTEIPQEWHHLAGLPLADDYHNAAPVMAVLEVYTAIVLPQIRRGLPQAPIAQATRLGWLLMGSTTQARATRHANCNTLQSEFDPLLDQLRRFWSLEEVPEANTLTPEEEECEQHFRATHGRLEDGRYQVRVPFQRGAALGDSKPAARASLARLERRFQSQPELREAYVAFMGDYERLRHMSRVTETSHDGGPVFFLPHHPVIKGSGATLKVRVVFNASQTCASGASLNSMVRVGPRLQLDLGAILLRWRLAPVVFIADIEQMYRQIQVHSEDQPLQRILWRFGPTEPVHVYQLHTVTYGTACAPFLALRVLKQLAIDEGHRFPRAAKLLRQCTYVDDVLADADTVQEALALQQEIGDLLRAGGFSLKNTSVLGVRWVPGEDAFAYGDALSLPSTATKRAILSAIARIFDPLGWISPVVIAGKILLQELWLAGVGWDATLPQTLATQWQHYRRDLNDVSDIRLHRWLGFTGPEAVAEVHGFCDASERAYAAAIYMVVRVRERQPVSRLLTAKSKVSPVKRVSLPRLELCGAHLLARLLRWVRETLSPVSTVTHCWTDSMVALTWIRQHPSRWDTFVENRVAAIHELLFSVHWGHVPTKENPADCASRGLSPRSLRDQRL